MPSSIDLTNYFKNVIELAKLSPDPRTQVGAVLLDVNGELLSEGYNHPLRGCADYTSLNLPKNFVMRHAERTAICEAIAKYGAQAVVGSSMVTNSVPCRDCSDDCITYGVRSIYILKSYDKLVPTDKITYFKNCEKLLTSAGVFVYRVDCALNKKLLFDGELINV